MLISEILEWQWAITWDNADPNSDSTKLISAFEQLGAISKMETKTTVILSPKANVADREIRDVIANNLDQSKGNAVYVNIKTREAYEWGTHTGHVWTKAN